MEARTLRVRHEAGTSVVYALHVRVTVTVESAGDGPVTQIAEVRGRIGLEVTRVEDGRAHVAVTTEHLEGEVPSHGLFGQAAVADPLASLPGAFEVDDRGRTSVDGGGTALDALFPPVPEGPVAPGATWTVGPDGEVRVGGGEAGEPGALHCRYIGPEPDDGGVIRDVVGTFGGHAWKAGEGLGGVVVHGETRRMSEVQRRREDGWAQRVDGRVETTLVFRSPDEGGEGEISRRIETLVEVLLLRSEG